MDFRLYLITDRKSVGGKSLEARVEAALEGGLKAVCLREKDLGGRELLSLARTLREMTRRFGARLFINDRVDVALAVDADGVHLGQNSFSPMEVRSLLGPKRMIGVSTHSLREARIAAADGADFVTFGPVYDTPSKAAYGDPVGLEALAEAAAELSIPVFALGGVNAASIDELARSGAHGIALISAIIGAEDSFIATIELLGGCEESFK